MTRTAYDLREKRIICRPFGIDKRKSDLKCISEIHHIVKTAEFDMGVEESYEYGKCNKDNQNTGNCRVAETKKKSRIGYRTDNRRILQQLAAILLRRMNGKKSFRKWMNI